MYIPNPLPECSCAAYIFKDEVNGWFKVGSSADLDRRLADECRALHGKRSFGKVTRFHHWTFEFYFSALYLEKVAIETLLRFGYPKIRENDWFDPGEKIIVELMTYYLGPLARSINDWEADNHGTKRNAIEKNLIYGRRLRREYGDFLAQSRIDDRELYRRALASGATDDN